MRRRRRRNQTAPSSAVPVMNTALHGALDPVVASGLLTVGSVTEAAWAQLGASLNPGSDAAISPRPQTWRTTADTRANVHVLLLVTVLSCDGGPPPTFSREVRLFQP